jgi:KaiC/GvpD/RAD55 family RecA-like ATPase
MEAETILSTLFGLPTSIPGFDSLFCGGLMLQDSHDSGEADSGYGVTLEAETTGVRARTVLAIGPFGGGKSLLSLQIAVEVARKGGAAWVIAFEQTFEECKYALEAIGVSMQDPSFEVVHDIPGATISLAGRSDRGVIFFLRPGMTPNEPDAVFQKQFLEHVRSRLPLLRKFPLRLMLIDPINSVLEAKPGSATGVRRQVFGLLEEAKKMGVNIWCTCEQSEDRNIEGRFEENIADTVIRLSVDRGQPFQQRFMEVTKSRLQRERPGKHLFAIRSGSGTPITPPLGEVVWAGVDRARHGLHREVPVGLPGLSRLLREGTIMPADVVALVGPTGTSKTLFATQFLLGRELPHGRSLLVSDFSRAQMGAIVRDVAARKSDLRPHERKNPDREILLYPVRLGYTNPQAILAELHTMLEDQAIKGEPIDRAVVGNLSRWELGMPLLEKDPTFGSSLLSLFRSYGTTTVLTCGYTSEKSDTALKNLLLEQADCVLEFSSIRGGERFRQLVRAVKTRKMDHRSGRFDLEATPDSLRLGNETLFRESRSGSATAVPVRLFLHSETLIHRKYNERLVDALKTSISKGARLERQMHRFDEAVLGFGQSSAVDEVQILQLDEFQLPATNRSPSGDVLLHEFRLKDRPNLLLDRLPRLQAGTCRKADGQEPSCFAVPFYENFSLLAYRRKAFRNGFPGNWSKLAVACRRWESANPDPKKLFFGCQAAHSDRFESYNCVFFEILHSLMPLASVNGGCARSLVRWFEQANTKHVRSGVDHARTTVLAEALKIFQVLVRRSYDLISPHSLDFYDKSDMGEDAWEQAQFEANKDALVWRQWYNTLNQLLFATDVEARSDIEVRPIFGAQSDPHDYMTTAGTWYLAVPAYSAAPDLALDIVEFLTSADREWQRLSYGVGLPTRMSFYSGQPEHADDVSPSVSPYFEMQLSKLKELATNPKRVFRRSQFDFYSMFSEVLSSHLLRVLQIPDSSHTDDDIKRTIRSLLTGFDFVCEGRIRPDETVELAPHTSR